MIMRVEVRIDYLRMIYDLEVIKLRNFQLFVLKWKW